ncbi:MAG: D-glycero-beta-D-manno-heptose 1-phosphate adenylyltransferase [Acidobacteria bacterium]|nr:D-glycero-beta-D-manno-heptose 1-phosphate adenylyltransferase [Acidobacteriota bacterium]
MSTDQQTLDRQTLDHQTLDRQTIADLLHAIAGVGVLVVGDFMVDRTIYGEASRISPEAPAPVILVKETRQQLGGAGNVVRNVDSLGGKVWCAAVVGEDETGELLEQELRAVRSCQGLQVVREQGRKTTLKSRVVATQAGRLAENAAPFGHHQVLRFDEESRHPISAASVAQVLAFAARVIGEVQGVVVSDYAKGALPADLFQQLIALARKAGKPVVVDPKEKDWHRYAGASVLTPNSAEADAALEAAFSASSSASSSAASSEAAGKEWESTLQARLKEFSLDAVLITRGAEGLSLMDRTGFHHLPTSAREVFDVTGAGDTVLAAFSLAVASGVTYSEAAQLANLAAGVVVGKAGAAVVYPFEVERELDVRRFSASAKIQPREGLGALMETLRKENKKIVFTNGCFDLLHVGHMYLLREAKLLGDVLVVGLNSDASVRRFKGNHRPIVSAEDRAYAIAALESVDYLVIFDEPDPMELLQLIRPHVLVKGDDYAESEVVGADFLKTYGGVTRLIPIRRGISTSRLLEKIRSAPA